MTFAVQPESHGVCAAASNIPTPGQTATGLCQMGSQHSYRPYMSQGGNRQASADAPEHVLAGAQTTVAGTAAAPQAHLPFQASDPLSTPHAVPGAPPVQPSRFPDHGTKSLAEGMTNVGGADAANAPAALRAIGAAPPPAPPASNTADRQRYEAVLDAAAGTLASQQPDIAPALSVPPATEGAPVLLAM